jgi:hypothetical protein
MQLRNRHPKIIWIHADPDPQHNPGFIITLQKIYLTPILIYQLTFEYLLVENSVPQDVQRDPGHIQRENHQRELLPQNPDCILDLTESGTVGRFFHQVLSRCENLYFDAINRKISRKTPSSNFSKVARNAGFYLKH